MTLGQWDTDSLLEASAIKLYLTVACKDGTGGHSLQKEEIAGS